MSGLLSCESQSLASRLRAILKVTATLVLHTIPGGANKGWTAALCPHPLYRWPALTALTDFGVVWRLVFRPVTAPS